MVRDLEPRHECRLCIGHECGHLLARPVVILHPGVREVDKRDAWLTGEAVTDKDVLWRVGRVLGPRMDADDVVTIVPGAAEYWVCWERGKRREKEG